VAEGEKAMSGLTGEARDKVEAEFKAKINKVNAASKAQVSQIKSAA